MAPRYSAENAIHISRDNKAGFSCHVMTCSPETGPGIMSVWPQEVRHAEESILVSGLRKETLIACESAPTKVCTCMGHPWGREN